MEWVCTAALPTERTILLTEFTDQPVCYQAEIGDTGAFTWWLPGGADAWVLPICAGVRVESAHTDRMRWLQNGSPWSLLELPVLGLQFDNHMGVIIVPWPHYAELIITDRVGIRFTYPKDRHQATPTEIVTLRRGADPLEVALAFREWRRSATEVGAIPRPRPLEKKISELKRAARLPGAPHLYLWGPALFSRHDIDRNQWIPYARALHGAAPESLGGRLCACFTEDQRSALEELAQAEWPMKHLILAVAGAMDAALTRRDLLRLDTQVPEAEVIRRNQQAVAQTFSNFMHAPESWGDGLSLPLLKSLHDAGVDRALLLLCDLYGHSLRPEVAAQAEAWGFLLGPYDSYHSIHAPDAAPDDTWETAQFDVTAYERGRVINADGSGHAGFMGRGYHFSPQAAWPYVQQRVGRIVRQTPFSAWFIDCDATAECFDDYSPAHPATRVEDARLRRQRLTWLETTHRMVVGSEGGSVLFADVIHFGHGVHTPYIGHLDPALRDRQSPHFLGRHWPPDTPEQSFKPVPVPPSLKSPFFDPTMRLPLYQAALGDELIVTHHWSFDSLKFADIQGTRELLEILYMVPPMYHLNRETWAQRRERILGHLAFWNPLHRSLACAPLTGWEVLSTDRMVQRTTFQTRRGEVTLTVNFGESVQVGCLARSAAVAGPIDVPLREYRLGR